ncbi:MAG: type II toxin-antitoxin system mRNA interferase toxin, RelE/StbE family [Caldilineaceae bacterium]
MQYQLKPFRKNVQRQLRNLPGRIQREATQIILELQDEPFPLNSEELRDHYQGIYKIKIDGWRIFYRVDTDAKTVDVINIKRRTPNTYTSLYTLLF